MDRAILGPVVISRPDTLDTKIATALELVARALQVIRQHEATELGVTRLQLDVLRLVASDPPPPHSPTALSFELGVRQPTVSEAISALVSKGMLRRRSDPVDSRRTVLELTETALSMLEDTTLAVPLAGAVAGAGDDDTKAEAYMLLLGVLAGLSTDSSLPVARTCLTCAHYQAAPGPRCEFLGVDLDAYGHEVDCPDHLAGA